MDRELDPGVVDASTRMPAESDTCLALADICLAQADNCVAEGDVCLAQPAANELQRAIRLPSGRAAARKANASQLPRARGRLREPAGW
jgi:hypothetical protein